MKLQKLTSKGMRQLKTDLEKISKENTADPTINIKKYETKNIDHIEIDKDKKFDDKLSVGKYFLHVFPEEFQPNVQIWNWLAIFYYKQLLTAHGKIGELQRLFVSESLPDPLYRHLLKAPYDICKFYKNKLNEINFLLLDKVNTNGELYRRIVESPEIRKNPHFMEVACQFFYNKNTKSLRKDIGVTESIKRLIKVWRQYERGFDMYRMPSETIVKKLLSKHDEFEKFIYN